MTLNDLITEWKSDSKIDATDLTGESQRIYDLHGKYLDLLSQERLKLKAIELEIKRLKLDKHQFYKQGPSKEQKNWDYPASGKIMIADVPLFLDADKQLQELEIRKEMSQTRVYALEKIMDAIKSRNYIIGNIIRWEMYKGGS